LSKAAEKYHQPRGLCSYITSIGKAALRTDNIFPLLRQACQTRRKNIICPQGFCSILLDGKKILEHDSNFKRDGEASQSEALATGREENNFCKP